MCPCGETQMMSHIVESCPVTKLNGGLSRLHSADEDAVSWLTSYGLWHAYVKKCDSHQLLRSRHHCCTRWFIKCHFQVFAYGWYGYDLNVLVACIILMHCIPHNERQSCYWMREYIVGSLLEVLGFPSRECSRYIKRVNVLWQLFSFIECYHYSFLFASKFVLSAAAHGRWVKSCCVTQ